MTQSLLKLWDHVSNHDTQKHFFCFSLLWRTNLKVSKGIFAAKSGYFQENPMKIESFETFSIKISAILFVVSRAITWICPLYFQDEHLYKNETFYSFVVSNEHSIKQISIIRCNTSSASLLSSVFCMYLKGRKISGNL